MVSSKPKIRRRAAGGIAAVVVLASSLARAAEGDAPGAQRQSAPEPWLYHAPLAVAIAHEPLVIEARIEHPELVRSAVLVYRTGGGPYAQVPFRRLPAGDYVASIPAEQVVEPGLDYAIEIERPSGARVAAFSTPADPQHVQVREEGMDLVERALERKLEGRRSELTARGEYVSFGKSTAQVEGPGGVLEHQSVDDRYYRVEGAYAYRPLRAVSELSLRAGVIRGSAPVPVRELIPGQDEGERFDVGLNYAAPTVRFRLHDKWHIDGSLLASVTEVGFSAGTGAALHIGDPRGSKFSVGFETIQSLAAETSFGTRFFTELDIQAHRRLRVSPIIEVSDMPSAEHFGVRLIGEVGVDIGHGFSATARTGYQARDVTSGGVSGGGSVSYAF
ncbi:MAG: hypothetical protein HY744_18115 [Deltaproteobacteria bacterium]|nr:hypothetical protein [Deltaproteobacteria bacterium]